jgi:hypothetical protein
VLLTLALVAAGCRRSDRSKDWLPVHPTSGTVTVKGKPAEGAKIIFHPLNPADGKTVYPFARVGADGAFRLTTYASNDGAPAGEYAVTIVWPAPPENPDDEPFGGPDQLKGAYANPKKPLLKATVKEGDNPLPSFEITTR